MQTHRRVLIIDDQQVIATTLAAILNNSGFEAAAAFSGPDGLKLAHSSVFDILITDMNMSPLSGIQTAKAFRDIHPNAHIFLLTGTIGDEDAMRERDKEGLKFEILRKPLHPLRVIEALRGLGSNAPSVTT
jgi:CheY-like chemotaxis protein